MTQEDIDRLLICRAAVDKLREFNKSRVEAYTTCKSVTEAKTLIETKTGDVTTISSSNAIKTPNAIKATLESERTKYTIEMYDVIHGQGFESFKDFIEFNNKMNIDAYKECHPLQGKCDWCGEKEIKDQPCVKAFSVSGILSCAGRQDVEQPVDGVWRWCLQQERDGKPVYMCPEGHGWKSDEKSYKDFPFDVFWRI